MTAPTPRPLVAQFGSNSDPAFRRELRDAISKLNRAKRPLPTTAAWVDSATLDFDYRLAQLTMLGLLAFGHKGPTTYSTMGMPQLRYEYFQRIAEKCGTAYMIHSSDAMERFPVVIQVCDDEGRPVCETDPVTAFGYTAVLPVNRDAFEEYSSGLLNQFEFDMPAPQGVDHVAFSMKSTNSIYIQAIFKVPHLAFAQQGPDAEYTPHQQRVRKDAAFARGEVSVDDPITALGGNISPGWANHHLAKHIGLMHKAAGVPLREHLRHAAMESTTSRGQHFIEKFCDYYYRVDKRSKDHFNPIYRHDFFSSTPEPSLRAKENRAKFLDEAAAYGDT